MTDDPRAPLDIRIDGPEREGLTGVCLKDRSYLPAGGQFLHAALGASKQWQIPNHRSRKLMAYVEIRAGFLGFEIKRVLRQNRPPGNRKHVRRVVDRVRPRVARRKLVAVTVPLTRLQLQGVIGGAGRVFEHLISAQVRIRPLGKAGWIASG